MPKFPRGLLAGITVLLFASTAPARTLYVATNGSDQSGDGSASKPYRTVRYAVDKRMRNGDVVRIRPGTYAETGINVKYSGTIRADSPANKPEIDLSNSDSGGYVNIWANNVTWDGVNVRDGNRNIVVGRNDASKPKPKNVTIKDCRIYKSWGQGIRLVNCMDIDIINVELRECGQVNVARDGANNWPHAILGINADRVLVQGCKAWRNHGEGIGPYYGCSDWIIRNNRVFDNWSVNIYVDTDEGNCTVESNFCFNTNYRKSSNPRTWPVGIRVANEIADFPGNDPTPNVKGIKIINNIVTNCGGGIEAFSYRGGASFDPSKHFFLDGAKILNNTISRCNRGGRKGITIRNAVATQLKNIINYNSSGTTLSGQVWTAGSIFAGNPRFIGGSGANSGTSTRPEDYKISGSSPCRDSGVKTGISTDFGGRARPRGSAYDIGAWEY